MSSSRYSEIELEELRRMGPEGRLRIAFELSRREYDRVANGIRSEFPEMTERQVMRELIRRIHGIDLPSIY